MKLAKTKLAWGLLLVVLLASQAFGLMPKSLLPTAAALDGTKFVDAKGKERSLKASDLQFLNPFTISDNSSTDSQSYNKHSLYNTSSVNCDNGTDNIFFCGSDNDGDTFGARNSVGLATWYWPSGDGKMVGNAVNGKCVSAFVMSVSIDTAYGVADANAVRGGHLSVVTPQINGNSKCIVKDNDSRIVTTSDLEGMGITPVDESHIAAFDQAYGCTGDGYGDNSNTVNANNCIVNAKYIYGGRRFIEGNGNSSTIQSFLAFGTLFHWTDPNTLQSYFDNSKSISKITNAVQLKSITDRLKSDTGSIKKFSDTTQYDYYTNDSCFDAANNRYKALLAVSHNDNSRGQVLRAKDKSYDNYWVDGFGNDIKCMVTNTSGDNLRTNPALVAYHDAPDSALRSFIGLADTAIQAGNKATVNTGGSGGGGSGTGNSSPTCEASGYSLGWILCPIINGLANTADGIYNNIIEPLLLTKPLDINNTSDTYSQTIYKIWSSFRVYADIFLVIALLVIVFGESIGGGLIDAYTVKKSLPRVLIAAILINLSIYIVAILVDITNIIGKGLISLITAPFQLNNDYNIPINNLGAGIGALGVGAFFAGAIFAVTHPEVLMFLFLFVILPILLILIAIMAVVILRRGLIILLAVLAPVAFALYCLPNTEKYFKQWWDTLLKTLLVFPIVAVLFALGKVTAVTVSQGTTGMGLTPAIAGLLAIFALFVPLALIPFAFKLAGGVIGKVFEVAAGYGKKAHQGILGSEHNPYSLRNKAKRGATEVLTASQYKRVEAGRQLGASRYQKLRGKAARMLGANVDERYARYQAESNKRRAALSDTGKDDLIFAAGGYAVGRGQTFGNHAIGYNRATGKVDDTSVRGQTNNGPTRYFNVKGEEISADMYNQGKSLYGSNDSDLTQSYQYGIHKITDDQQRGAYLEAFGRTADKRGWNKTQVNNAHQGASYPQKGKHGSLKHGSWAIGASGTYEFTGIEDDKNYRSFLSDKHKTVQAFQLGEMREQDWQIMRDKQEELEHKLADHHLNGSAWDAKDSADLAMTYEIFDAASQKMQTMPDSSGTASAPEIAASGAAAGAQSIIKDSVKNRRYKLSNRAGATDGEKVLDGTSGTQTGVYTTGESISGKRL